MEQQITTQLPELTEADRLEYGKWWNELSETWQKAFNQVFFGKGETLLTPTDEQLHSLWHTEVLRFAGPKALYPNISFELDNLDGLSPLKKLKILVVAHHQISSIKLLTAHTALESLFVFDNCLKSISGIEKLFNLKMFYFQNNQITSLEPLKKLTQLEDVYATNNQLTNLAGITEKHSDKLRTFRILPNNNLPQKEIIKMENRIGIRCLKG